MRKLLLFSLVVVLTVPPALARADDVVVVRSDNRWDDPEYWSSPFARAGSFGLGGATTLDTVTVEASGAGGRRDGKKIGRSRVAENCLIGIAHSGLALRGRSAGAFGVAGGMVTSTTVVVMGSLQVEGTEAFAFAPSA